MYGFMGLYGSPYGQRPLTAGQVRAGMTQAPYRPPSATPAWVLKKMGKDPAVEGQTDEQTDEQTEEGTEEGTEDEAPPAPDMTRLLVGGLLAAGAIGGVYFLFFRKKK